MTDRDATAGAGTAVVLVAHGSRVAAANEAHQRLAALLADRPGIQVVAAFLELATPAIPEALDVAASAGEAVLVLPYFLLPGAHTTRDIPELVESARDRWPAVRFDLLPHVGADDALIGLLAGQVATALR